MPKQGPLAELRRYFNPQKSAKRRLNLKKFDAANYGGPKMDDLLRDIYGFPFHLAKVAIKDRFFEDGSKSKGKQRMYNDVALLPHQSRQDAERYITSSRSGKVFHLLRLLKNLPQTAAESAISRRTALDEDIIPGLGILYKQPKGLATRPGSGSRKAVATARGNIINSYADDLRADTARHEMRHVDQFARKDLKYKPTPPGTGYDDPDTFEGWANRGREVYKLTPHGQKLYGAKRTFSQKEIDKLMAAIKRRQKRLLDAGFTQQELDDMGI